MTIYVTTNNQNCYILSSTMQLFISETDLKPFGGHNSDEKLFAILLKLILNHYLKKITK